MLNVRILVGNKYGKNECNECGRVFDGKLADCPNCGCPATECVPLDETIGETAEPLRSETSTEVDDMANIVRKNDWANTVYECGALYRDTLSNRYFDFCGRASRTEYWSFVFITLCLGATSWGIMYLVTIIPLFAVSVRRCHDINRSGWWLLVPWVSFFFKFKKSDEGENDYGYTKAINL